MPLLEQLGRHPSKGQADFLAACLAAATPVGTCARLARRDFDVGVEILACAWVLELIQDAIPIVAAGRRVTATQAQSPKVAAGRVAYIQLVFSRILCRLF